MVDTLVVEDNAVIRKVIEKTIEICGFDNSKLYEATNGKEGLTILKNHNVDLLLIDINMPVMDGMQMLHEVKKIEQNKNLPILIVSSESNKERIEEIHSVGAEFIHKPFTPEKLRREIVEIIDKKIP